MSTQCLLLCGNTILPGVLRNAGPARLATSLRDAGFDTVCADIGAISAKNNNTHLLDKIVKKFVGPDTLWVGISTTFLSHIFDMPIGRMVDNSEQEIPKDSLFQHFLDLCKTINPNVKFILGGGYYMNLSKYGFYHFRGYADYELIEFTKWCRESSYKMVNVNRLGKVIECKEYSDFVTSQIKWHETDFITPNDTLPIEVSRGCIFRCKFCAFPLNGKSKGEWIKHCDVLRDELINNYEKYGVTRYIFSDDTYNDSADKITSLYEEVFSKLPFQLTFSSYIRLDLLHRFQETAEVLQKSGLRSALLGIETNNHESAKAIGKGLEFEKQIEYIKHLKQNELKNTLFTSGFIFGLPKDTKESMNELENFLLSKENPIDHWICRPLGINPVNNSLQKKYFSEFDLNYEKYGYTITGQDPLADVYRMKWELKGSDIDYDYCLEQTNRITRLSDDLPNYKFGGQLFGRFSTVIPEEDVFALSRKELREKYDIRALVVAYINNYYNSLLAY